MKKIALLLTMICLLSINVQAAEGLITKTSKYSVVVTMDRLEKIVRDKGFNVVARIDHAAAAKVSGSALLPTELLIFGKPKLGTRLMKSEQTIGIDLPIKVLVWENEKGVVTLSYNDPEWLKKRHGITDRDKVFGKMAGALNKFTEAAVK